MKKLLPTIWVFLLSILSSSAQVKYEKRIDFKVDDVNSEYRAFTFEERGVVLCYQKAVKKGSLVETYFDTYSKDLELTESRKIAERDKEGEDFYAGTEKTVHAIVLDKKNNFTLITLSVGKNEIKKVQGVLPPKMKFVHMVALGDYVYLCGSGKKEHGVFSINWETGLLKMSPIELPNVKPGNIELKYFLLSKAGQEVALFLKVKSDKNTSDFFMLRADKDGLRKDIVNVSAQANVNVLSARAAHLNDDNFVFMGTYAPNAGKVSEGFYISKWNGSKTDFVALYPFTEMKGFLDEVPLSIKERNGMEKKIQTNQDKGMELGSNYRMALHDLIVQPDGYLVIAECYLETYYSEQVTDVKYVDGRSQTFTYTQKYFDGYYYTHAMLMKFGLDGKMVWSQKLKLSADQKPLGEMMYVQETNKPNNSIDIVYGLEDKLMEKTIDKDGNINNESEKPIEKMPEAAAFDRFNNYDLQPWYQHYLIASGYQIFLDRRNTTAFNNKIIFYLAKVRYEKGSH